MLNLSISTLGFRLRLLDSNQRDLPKENSYLYVLWDEESSVAPRGWYLSKVTSISPDGLATLYYRKGKSYENINVTNTEWAAAPGISVLVRSREVILLLYNYYTFESVYDGDHDGVVRIFVGFSCEL